MRKETERRLRKVARIESANAFIRSIASCGRKFFAHEGRVATIEQDSRGKLWMINEWSQKRIYIGDRRQPWKDFHHGGTLRRLVEELVIFIREGGPRFGDTFGKHWGYDSESIASIVKEGRRLEIIFAQPERDYEAEMKLPEGKTCGDCRHIARCLGLGCTWQARTSCDFHPSRFIPIAKAAEVAAT